MQSLQLTAANLTALLGNGQAAPQAKDAANTSGDPFASLLDAVGDVVDKSQARPADKGSEREDERDKDPLAAIVEVKNQATLEPTKPREREQVAYTRTEKKPEENRRELPVAAKPAEKNAEPEKAAQAPVAKDAVSKGAAAADEAGLDTEARDTMQEKISNRIEMLSSIMNVLSTLLAKANGMIAQVTMSSVTTVQVNMAVAANTEMQAAAAQSTLLAGQGDVTPEGLFADTHQLLQQIQQLLQNADGAAQGAPLAPEAQAQLDALNQALAKDVGALKALFAQAHAVAEEGEALSLPQTASSLEEAKHTLKQDIALIRDVLQKLNHTAPEAAHSIAKPQPQTQLAADILSVDAQTLQHDQLKTRGEDVVKALPAIAQAAVQVDATSQVNNSNQPAAGVAVVQAANFNTRSDSGMSGQGRQQGQAGQAFALAGLSASQPNTASSVNNSFSQVMGRASQASVTEQVVFHVKTAIGNGSSKIHIQLAPEELGKLDIKLHVDAAGKTGVVITADTQNTLDVLQKDASGLQKALADAGLKADSGSLSFNLRGGQHGQQGQEGSQAAAHYRKSQPEENIDPATVTRSYTVALPDGLDIRI